MDNKSSTSSRSPGDVEGEPVAKKSRLVLKTIIYDESVANQWLDEPPLEVWDHHIIPLLSLKDLALARPKLNHILFSFYIFRAVLIFPCFNIFNYLYICRFKRKSIATIIASLLFLI